MIKRDKALGEEYTLFEHSSGLMVYLMKKQGYNSNYAIFGTRYGSCDIEFEVDGRTVRVPDGVAHFLEHKLFESPEKDAFELFEETGAYANAYTSFDRTSYLFGCSENLKENLKILLNFVSSPYFTKETVEKEQGIIGQEINMYLDSPDWRVLFNLLGALYHNNPVKIDIAGSVESIAKIDDGLLYDCYNKFYTPKNMYLVVVGDFDFDEIREIIDQNVKTPEVVSAVQKSYPSEPKGIVKDFVSQKLSVNKPMFMLGYKIDIEGLYPDAKTVASMEVLLEMLAGEFSPLYLRLLDQNLLNDTFDCEFFTTANTAVVIFSGETDDTAKASEEIKNYIDAQIEAFSEEDFLSAKKRCFGKMILSFDKVESLASQLVESAVSGLEPFEMVEVYRNLTAKDVYNALKLLKRDCSALSTIVGK